MSGIMAAIAGNAQNIAYADGLFAVGVGADLSPITDSVSTTGSVTVTKDWIGYFLSPFTGSVSLSVQTTRSAGAGGGSASTTGRLWLGDNAAAGNNAAANITANNNQTSSANFELAAGIYYPLRIRWNGSYQGGSFFFSSTSSGGSITFLASGSTDVSGQIFYNQFTNGF